MNLQDIPVLQGSNNPDKRLTSITDKHVLVVEDDFHVAELLRTHLLDEGFQVSVALDGNLASAKIRARQWDLVVLDVVLPVIDGHALCRQIRALPHYTPIIMTSVRSSELHRILGLELGADDYVPKPYSVLELVARVKAAIRRTDALVRHMIEGTQSFRVAGVELNAVAREVRIDEQPIDLTPREFDLLSFLARNPGKVFSRTALLDQVWGYQYHGYEHTVNTHINRLRLKVERDPANPERILTVWGRGYKFAATKHTDQAEE